MQTYKIVHSKYHRWTKNSHIPTPKSVVHASNLMLFLLFSFFSFLILLTFFTFISFVMLLYSVYTNASKIPLQSLIGKPYVLQTVKHHSHGALLLVSTVPTVRRSSTNQKVSLLLSITEDINKIKIFIISKYQRHAFP